MLATIRSRLRRAAQRGQVKRASAAYVVTDGIIRAVHKRWSQETSARDYVDWLTAQRQQK